MLHRINQIFLYSLIFLMASNSPTISQGITRSKGIGFRAGFWNITGHSTRISTSGYGAQGSVDIGGAGGCIYFFTRVHNNWFMELSVGGFGGVHEQISEYLAERVETTSIVPFLVGLRYDLLSPRFPTAIQPYLSFGAGPYWISKVQTKNNFAIYDEVNLESGLKYGAYGGMGINLLATNWLAFNFDLRYHLMDFQFEAQYSGLEFGLGLAIMWGEKQEMFQIKDIKLVVHDIYPAYYQFYNVFPIALVSIKNISSYPIEVKVRSLVKPYSERPKDSEYIRIENGKTIDIPVTAIFGKKLLELAQREPAILDMEIEARAGRVVSRTISERITLHSKNAWDGKMDKLSFFVTADDEEILNLSRSIISNLKLNSGAEVLNFDKAREIFEKLRRLGICYRSDPNIVFYKDDRVQFARETIQLKSGDCDDLVILYASLLESLGINTAFIEVRDPEKEIAHLYLLFDTSLENDNSFLISSNDKRYVIRGKANGKKSIWIPVETTLIEQGFEEAWKFGATSYYKEGVIRNGLIDGWMRLIDVE